MSFTEYMNLSFSYRKRLTYYCISRGNEAKEIRLRLSIIDAFDAKSQHDEIFRENIAKWILRKKGYSTNKLFALCKEVGFDFFNDSIDVTNAICTLDSVQ